MLEKKENGYSFEELGRMTNEELDEVFSYLDEEEEEETEGDFTPNPARETIAVVPMNETEWAIVYDLLQAEIRKKGLENIDSIRCAELIDKMTQYHN